MDWSSAILLFVVISALTTIFTRHISLIDRRTFYLVGLFMYCTVALAGFVYSLIATKGLPSLPADPGVWALLLTQGVLIPGSWVARYKLIGAFGAMNSSLLEALNYIVVAIFGIWMLNEDLSLGFLIGFSLIIFGSVLAFRIKPDKKHTNVMPLVKSISLILIMTMAYGYGMLQEKKAIDIIGNWDYYVFGWGLQAVGAATLIFLFGHKELRYISLRGIKNGTLLGLITSIGGGLYIYAVSQGALSQTIAVASSKTILVAVLAALFFKEYNSWRLRLVALTLSVVGVGFLIR